jgi:hypothetical protein
MAERFNPSVADPPVVTLLTEWGMSYPTRFLLGFYELHKENNDKIQM